MELGHQKKIGSNSRAVNVAKGFRNGLCRPRLRPEALEPKVNLDCNVRPSQKERKEVDCEPLIKDRKVNTSQRNIRRRKNISKCFIPQMAFLYSLFSNPM